MYEVKTPGARYAGGLAEPDLDALLDLLDDMEGAA